MPRIIPHVKRGNTASLILRQADLPVEKTTILQNLSVTYASYDFTVVTCAIMAVKRVVVYPFIEARDTL